MSFCPAFGTTKLVAKRRLSIKCFALAAVLIGLATVPALADAVTYTGTLGGQSIVLELTEAKDGPLVGRYSYLSRGADIRLHLLSASIDGAVLAEEVPCTPALCERQDGNLVLDPPLGGQFELHYSADGTTLTGTWRASASAPAELPVNLTRFGQRTYNSPDVDAYLSFLRISYSDTRIMPETSPYDYAKMQVALDEGPLRAKDGATYRDVTDPRTKFAFPRVVTLPGGGAVEPVNAMLDQRRWAINFSGFECLSMDYRSGGWMALPFGTGGNSLGGVDREVISVDYLSDTVMTIRRVGSYTCGEGDRYDFIAYHTYDVRAGSLLNLSEIFKDWDATRNEPTQPLIEWILAAYRKTTGYDANHASYCVTSETLTEALEVRFEQGDVAVFLIGDMEDPGCVGAIVSAPLADIKGLLRDQAVDYFPSLKS